MAQNLSNVFQQVALKAISRTTSADGGAVDLINVVSNHELKAILNQGTATGTTISVAVKLQESDTTTAGDFTDISGATFTALSGTESDQAIQFKTNKRYVRAVATHGTDMTAATYAVLILGVKKVF